MQAAQYDSANDLGDHSQSEIPNRTPTPFPVLHSPTHHDSHDRHTCAMNDIRMNMM